MYLHPALGTYSALDISVADPALVNMFTRAVHDDLCGSDHFPTILDAVSPSLRFPSQDGNFTRQTGILSVLPALINLQWNT